jgi:hypothetical protein
MTAASEAKTPTEGIKPALHHFSCWPNVLRRIFVLPRALYFQMYAFCK